MRTFLKILIALLLLFNGTGALYGGGNLILYPDGSSIQLSQEWLRNTPFHNYFIPGIILFVSNGLFSIFVFVALLLKRRNYSWFVKAQGTILTGWIIIQILLIQTINFLHILMGSIGLSLVLLGWIQKKLYDSN